ncbi:Phophatidylserine decarboxylase-domain-containing protein [Xylaria sp. CBS 124048]|nr:Phophatidylserine decarboxylase-domain-containing protein [Xylaria sp. CBS 124048]
MATGLTSPKKAECTDHRVQHDWMAKQIAHVDKHGPQKLTPALQEFKDFIEGNTRIYMYFEQMWHEVPHKKPYDKDPTGQRQIRDYRHMLNVLNHVFTQAPQWNETAFGVGMVGVPMVSIFDYVMATPSGHAAFLDPDVNKMIKKVLNEWGEFLKSPKSAEALTTGPSGWFSQYGKADLMEVGNAPLGTHHSFEDMYVCDPNAEHYGYKSWDDFFTRELRPNIRPIPDPSNPSLISNACESRPYNLSRHARLRDRFWIKAQPYSVLDMLAHDPLSAQFDRATIYQAFLSALSYHRWHSPVAGRVVRAFVRDGTYFSEPLRGREEVSTAESKDNDSEEKRAAKQPLSVYEIDPKGFVKSQGYLTALATRAVIFIQADNPAIGLMAFIGVGMDEVSTCDITVKEGQHIRRGDQLGMFHFGGSSHCLLFRESVKVSGFPAMGQEHNIPVMGQLATVSS